MTEQMPLIADIAGGAAHRRADRRKNRRNNGMQRQQPHAETAYGCDCFAPATARWTA
jgi:hypothetical protein